MNKIVNGVANDYEFNDIGYYQEINIPARQIGKTYQVINMYEQKYKQLQSNWNSLRECIEENKKVAMEYTKKVELSGLCQGDYLVPYYHAIKRIDLDNLYLDKMNELEGKK